MLKYTNKSNYAATRDTLKYYKWAMHLLSYTIKTKKAIIRNTKIDKHAAKTIKRNALVDNICVSYVNEICTKIQYT